MKTYKNTIRSIEKALKQYNETIYKKATQDEIENFLEWALKMDKEFDSKEFQEFIRDINGMDFNGLVVYSLNDDDPQNIFKSNEIWHENENLREYIFFADSDIAWYCYHLDEKQYIELDKPSGESIQIFESFNEMLKEASSNVL